MAPELVRARVQRALYARVDGWLGTVGQRVAPDAATVERVDAILHALMAAGPLGPHGEDLTQVALERWDDLGPSSRWLRLVVLEGQRAARPEALARVVETIESDAPGEAAASLRFQALRTLKEMPLRPGVPPTLGRPGATWAWAERRATLEELVDLLLALRIELPDAWRALGAAPPDATPEGREALLECALFQALRSGARDDRELVRPRFEAFVSRPEEPLVHEERVRERIVVWSARGAGGLLAELFDELRAGGEPEARVTRRALATGRVGAERQEELLEAAILAPNDDPDGLRMLGALCAGPSRNLARQVLKSRVVRASGGIEDRGAALALAARVLQEARLEAELRQFESTIAQLKPPPLLMAEYRRQSTRERPAPPLERRERSLALTGPP